MEECDIWKIAKGKRKNNERKKDDKLDVESSCFSVSDQTRGKALF